MSCRRRLKTCWPNAKWREVSWRAGTKGRLKARFAALRVRIADGPPQRIWDKGQQHLPGDEAWLIGEHRTSGEKKYYLANLPARHGPARPGGHDQGAMGLRAGPSAIERGTRPRSLRGTIVGRPSSSCAHDNDRLRLPPASPPHQRAGGKKRINGPPPQPSLPAVRHAIISLFIRSPPRRCPHCRTWIETLPQPE